MRKFFSGIVITCCGVALLNCSEKPAASEETAFTKQDSVTDTYLAFQDSILWSWNVMINDDNQKIKAMHNLIHELMVSNPDQNETFRNFEERLEQLTHLRYNQKTIANADAVEEYDFASSTLVTELLTLAESQSEFAYNTTLQTLAEEIRMADERVANYRADYDAVVTGYNQFLDRNKNFLSEVDHNTMPEKKPLFQMVSE
jgi:hypothetical protein